MFLREMFTIFVGKHFLLKAGLPYKPMSKNIHTILNWLIAWVWIINGLFCKLLNMVPRHRQIVREILGNDHALMFTNAIGFAEVLMAAWIFSGIRSNYCAASQIIIVLTMNILEFVMVPDLLLFGKFNMVVALIFISVVYLNEFVLNKKTGNAVIS